MGLGWGDFRRGWRGDHLFLYRLVASGLVRFHPGLWLGFGTRFALGIDWLRLRWRWRLAHMGLVRGLLRNGWRGNHLFLYCPLDRLLGRSGVVFGGRRLGRLFGSRFIRRLSSRVIDRLFGGGLLGRLSGRIDLRWFGSRLLGRLSGRFVDWLFNCGLFCRLLGRFVRGLLRFLAGREDGHKQDGNYRKIFHVPAPRKARILRRNFSANAAPLPSARKD